MNRVTMILLACLLVLAGTARSQEATTEAGPADRWSVTLAPYLWMISLDGNATVGGVKTDVDVPFKDSIKDLSFGGMLLGTVRKGRLGLSVNGVFTRVSTDNDVGATEVDARSDLGQITVAPFYRVVEHQYGQSASGKPMRFVLEPTAGARVNTLRAELQVRGGRQVDERETWVDPIVGTRFGIDLTDRIGLFGEGDVGGVVTGSDFAWNLQAYFGFRTSLFGRGVVIAAGYRAYSFDYDHDNFKVDVTQHGPIIGTSIRF